MPSCACDLMRTLPVHLCKGWSQVTPDGPIEHFVQQPGVLKWPMLLTVLPGVIALPWQERMATPAARRSSWSSMKPSVTALLNTSPPVSTEQHTADITALLKKKTETHCAMAPAPLTTQWPSRHPRSVWQGLTDSLLGR